MLQAFLQPCEAVVHGYFGISKKRLKKNSVMKSSFINVAKGVFRTQSTSYDVAFLRK